MPHGHMFWFLFLIAIMLFIAVYMLQECIKKWSMTDSQVRKKMRETDMIEMSELIQERYYNEEAGRILLPQGV